MRAQPKSIGTADLNDLGKVSPIFQAAVFQWMRGSRVKLKDLKQGEMTCYDKINASK